MDGVLVSPFDTGGLVAHLIPVRDWEDDARREFFFNHFSFPAQSIADLVRLYPTTGHERVSAYFRGERRLNPGLMRLLLANPATKIALLQFGRTPRARVRGYGRPARQAALKSVLDSFIGPAPRAHTSRSFDMRRTW